MQFTEADCFWGSQGRGGEVWVDGAVDMKLESAKVHNLKFNLFLEKQIVNNIVN